HGLGLLVVDDNSPDGTGKVADVLAEKYPLTVLHRKEKQGLGTAYAEAFRYILYELHFPSLQYIIHMDADFSHDPGVIPKMIEALKSYDAVIGSRYVRGGMIEEWNFLRRILSRGANWYARTILGLSYRDVTSGFRAYRVETLRRLANVSFSSIGYAFLVEVSYALRKLDCKVTEIPIVFIERREGNSKMALGIIAESFFNVLRLRFHNSDIDANV
ncbi:MAG: polyprenol monophosphomannose synthase, partial [Patescibacteria group bacterium]